MLAAGARGLKVSMDFSVVICLDMLQRFKESDQWIERREKEHPDDPQGSAQKERGWNLHTGATFALIARTNFR
jgi:hypothetical protein